jgi:hypothetical protein
MGVKSRKDQIFYCSHKEWIAMNSNKKLLVSAAGGLALVCALLAIIGGVGGYMYREQLLAALGLTQSLKTAQLLPEKTEFYTSFTPNIQALPGYDNLKAAYLDNPDVQAALDKFEAGMKDEANITYEADIKPWLGQEVVIAMTDLSSLMNDNFAEPEIIMAAQTANKEMSDKFIAKLVDEAAKDERPFTDELYQEVTLHVRAEGKEKLIVATFNDLVVITNQDKLMKEMINRAQGKNDQPSLADNLQFQKALAQLPPGTVVTLYIDTTSFFDNILDQSEVEISTEQANDVRAFQSLAMAGTLQPDGIQLDTVMIYDAAKMSEKTLALLQQPAFSNAVLEQVPADAIFVGTGKNLKEIWRRTRENLANMPDFEESLQDFEQEAGFSVDEDIFGWMTGEYALVVIEAEPPEEYIPPVGGYVLIETADVADTRKRVEKVAAAIEKDGDIPLEAETVDNLEVEAVLDPFSGDFYGGYTFHENYFVMGYTEDAFKAIGQAAQEPLANSPNFKLLQSKLPKSNYGYFYLDVDRARKVIEAQMGEYEQEDYEQEVRPFLEPLHAMGASASADHSTPGVSKTTFFAAISK